MTDLVSKLNQAGVLPIFGSRSANEILKLDIIRWLNTATARRNWTAATRNRWQAAFSLAFRVGIDNEKIDRNPAARIRRKMEDNGRIRFLGEEEETKIRRVLRD